MEKCRSMSNLYLSHEYLDEVMADYQRALRDYWLAKEDLGHAEYERDFREATLFRQGKIYNSKDKNQGTNDTMRKLYARTLLEGDEAIVQEATSALQRAEARYEAMRRELDAFRLHLQLQGLILRERELMPTPAIMRVGPATFFDEMVPFDETDYEATLRKIREVMAQEGLALDEDE